MKRLTLISLFPIALSSHICLSQEATQQCSTPDPDPETYMTTATPIINTTFNFVVVFVDFPDGRKPDGSLPTIDADLVFFNSTTINAVGSMGYVNTNANDPPDPNSPKTKKIRKYTYENYWDMYFSVGTYIDAGGNHPHPIPTTSLTAYKSTVV